MPLIALCSNPRCTYLFQSQDNKDEQSIEVPVLCPKCGSPVLSAHCHFPQGITNTNGSKHVDALPDRSARLSKREIQVVQFLAVGKSNKEVAVALNLSVTTVATYRTRVMFKIGAHSANELTIFAVRNHLIEI